MSSDIDAMRRTFGGLGDEDWLAVLKRSLNEPVIDGVEMPTFPADDIQIGLQGSAGVDAIDHAFSFFREVKAYAAFAGRPFQPGRTLLDFGCGWGRVIRTFMRDFAARDLYGAEPEPANVAIARRCNPYVNLLATPFIPPLTLDGGSFDYITALSVFSHLDAYAAERWFEEFHRILKPGGLVVFTTMPRAYLAYCATLRAELASSAQVDDVATQVKRSVAGSFTDLVAAEQAYDRGEFLFSPSMGRPPASHARWGWSLISPAYILKRWAGTYHLVDYVEDSTRLDQALIILQKRTNPAL